MEVLECRCDLSSVEHRARLTKAARLCECAFRSLSMTISVARTSRAMLSVCHAERMRAIASVYILGNACLLEVEEELPAVTVVHHQVELGRGLGSRVIHVS